MLIPTLQMRKLRLGEGESQSQLVRARAGFQTAAPGLGALPSQLHALWLMLLLRCFIVRECDPVHGDDDVFLWTFKIAYCHNCTNFGRTLCRSQCLDYCPLVD